ncbi:MAG: hypothetical protein ACYTG0_24770 [Planctomycetota bacterium]
MSLAIGILTPTPARPDSWPSLADVLDVEQQIHLLQSSDEESLRLQVARDLNAFLDRVPPLTRWKNDHIAARANWSPSTHQLLDRVVDALLKACKTDPSPTVKQATTASLSSIYDKLYEYREDENVPDDIRERFQDTREKIENAAEETNSELLNMDSVEFVRVWRFLKAVGKVQDAARELPDKEDEIQRFFDEKATICSRATALALIAESESQAARNVFRTGVEQVTDGEFAVLLAALEKTNHYELALVYRFGCDNDATRSPTKQCQVLRVFAGRLRSKGEGAEYGKFVKKFVEAYDKCFGPDKLTDILVDQLANRDSEASMGASLVLIYADKIHTLIGVLENARDRTASARAANALSFYRNRVCQSLHARLKYRQDVLDALQEALRLDDDDVSNAAATALFQWLPTEDTWGDHGIGEKDVDKWIWTIDEKIKNGRFHQKPTVGMPRDWQYDYPPGAPTEGSVAAREVLKSLVVSRIKKQEADLTSLKKDVERRLDGARKGENDWDLKTGEGRDAFRKFVKGEIDEITGLKVEGRTLREFLSREDQGDPKLSLKGVEQEITESMESVFAQVPLDDTPSFVELTFKGISEFLVATAKVLCVLMGLWTLLLLVWFTMYSVPQLRPYLVSAHTSAGRVPQGWLLGLPLPPQKVLLIDFFVGRAKVLDAWIEKHVRRGSQDVPKTGIRPDGYPPLPIAIDSEYHRGTYDELRSRVRERLDERPDDPVRVAISGEAASGKTSLLSQLDNWFLPKGTGEWIGEQPMIRVPIPTDAIDGSRDDPIGEGIRRGVQSLVGSRTRVSLQLVAALLRTRRIALFVDNWLRVSKPVQERLLADSDPDYPIRLLIVAGGIQKGALREHVHVRLLPLGNSDVRDFASQHLSCIGEDGSFADDELVELCDGLRDLGQDQGITPLLARFYVDEVVSERRSGSAAAVPLNVPRFILRYIDVLNKRVPDKWSDGKAREVARTVGWCCVEAELKASSASVEKVLSEFSDVPLDDWLFYLRERLGLLRSPGNADEVEFKLPVIAEYLAGMHVVRRHSKDTNVFWDEFLADLSTEEKHDPICSRRFLRILRDCCRVGGMEAGVAEFVVTEIDMLLLPAEARSSSDVGATENPPDESTDGVPESSDIGREEE